MHSDMCSVSNFARVPNRFKCLFALYHFPRQSNRVADRSNNNRTDMDSVSTFDPELIFPTKSVETSYSHAPSPLRAMSITVSGRSRSMMLSAASSPIGSVFLGFRTASLAVFQYRGCGFSMVACTASGFPLYTGDGATRQVLFR